MLPTAFETARLRVRDVRADDLADVELCLSETGDIVHLDPFFGPAPRQELLDLIGRSTAGAREAPRQAQMQMIHRRDDGHLLGYWHVMRVPGRPHTVGVGLMLIRPDFRRGGYGAEFIEAAAAHLRAGGEQELWARVFLRNHPALEFWGRQGFDHLRLHRGRIVQPPEDKRSLMLARVLAEPRQGADDATRR